MATLGEYYIQIMPSADGIGSQLSSIMDSQASAAGTSASGSFGSSFSSGLGTVAAVGAATFGVFTTAVAGATAALGGGISNLASYTDHIDKQSQKMNMSSESYQEWSAVMQHCGTSIDTMQSSMKTLSNAVENGNETFETLGISLEDASALSSEDLFSEVITQLQSMDDETERTYVASQLLGRGATELGALLNTSAEDTQAMKDRVQELGGVLSDDAIKAGAAYKDSLQDMSTAFSGLKNNMLVEFLPACTTVMDGLTEIFSGNSSEGLGLVKEGVTNFIDTLSDTIPEVTTTGNEIMSALITAISENSDAILTAGANTIITLATSLTQNLPNLVTSASEVVGQLGSAFLDLAPELLNTGLVILENLLNGIGENLDTVIPTVTSVVMEIVSVLVSHINELISAGLTIFVGLVDGLTQAIPVIIEALPSLIDSIISELTSSGTEIAEAGVELLSCLVNNLPAIIDSLTAALPEIIDSCVEYFTGGGYEQMLAASVVLFNALIEAFGDLVVQLAVSVANLQTTLITKISGIAGDLLSAGKTAFDGLLNGAKEKFEELKSTLSEKVNEWVTAIKNKVSEWKTAGGNLITGLWNGISDKAQWVYNQITSMGQTIINKVKGIFGIASPSKVFAEIGGYMAEGLGLGWDEEMTDVKNSIGNDLNFKGNLETTVSNSTASASGLSGATFTIHEYVDLGDTQLKEIVSNYTIQKVGNETRAVKVAQGGYY